MKSSDLRGTINIYDSHPRFVTIIIVDPRYKMNVFFQIVTRKTTKWIKDELIEAV